MARSRAPIVLALALTASLAFSGVTSPRAFFGFEIGDDYQLANYKQYEAYLRKLDKESSRMTVVSIGKTEEGREQLMAIVSDPANLRHLERHRAATEALARGRVAEEAEAQKLARDAKSVVWIDGGLHATEVLGAQQLIETAYQLVAREDPETRRIRKDVITLLVHANPDGMDLVSDWYMRRTKPEERSLSALPRLYEKYAGHDNNRDFFACNLAESVNMNRVLYREWFPHILYNHHQTAPAGSVIFVPPFRGPFNHHVDPLAQVQTDLVGMAMHQRFAAEGKPGAVMRNAASYQTWWNGGLRTTAYFHNMVGILTEAYGSPTPGRIAFTPSKLTPTNDVPFPIEPQVWHFKQSIAYELTANWAILDFASRNRENLLLNAWRMARNAISKGGTDTWTHYPGRVASNGDSIASLKKPELRDAKAYVIPAGQPDFPTAVKFANALIKNGVEVHRAKGAFSVGGKEYPAGSLVVKCGQAFRAHVLDMFEPQNYPNDFQYPGGPPIAPYDSAGYTLAFTMGVQFDRVIEKFDVAVEKVDGFAKAHVANGIPSGLTPAFEVSCKQNDAFTLAAEMLKSGVKVWRMAGGDPAAAPSADLGSLLIEAGPRSQDMVKLADELGIELKPAQRIPQAAVELKTPRVALLDRYGGSMESGWTRWILEQFRIPHAVIYPPDIDNGNLKDFDVLILVNGMAIGGGRGDIGAQASFSAPRSASILARDPSLAPSAPSTSSARDSEIAFASFASFASDLELSATRGDHQANPQSEIRNPQSDIPAEYRARQGSLTTAKSLPAIKAFLESGGTVLAIGSATRLGAQLGLPIASALTETVDGRERNLPREKFYCPGSVLRVKVDNSLPAAWGMPEYADVMNDNSPAFKLLEGWEKAGIKKIAWYETDKPLRSGWCWGQAYLKDAIAALEAPVGKGRVLLFGPEILFRGQTHASFKFLFNAAFGG